MKLPKGIAFTIYSYLVGVAFGIMDVALIGVMFAAIIPIMNSTPITQILSGLPYRLTVYKAITSYGYILSPITLALLFYPILLPLIIHNRFKSLLLVWLSAIYTEIVGDVIWWGSFSFHYSYLLRFMLIFLSMWWVTWLMRNIEKMAKQIGKGLDRKTTVKFVLTILIISLALPISVILVLSHYATEESSLLTLGRIIISPVESIIYFRLTSPLAFFTPIGVIVISCYMRHYLPKRSQRSGGPDVGGQNVHA